MVIGCKPCFAVFWSYYYLHLNFEQNFEHNILSGALDESFSDTLKYRQPPIFQDGKILLFTTLNGPQLSASNYNRYRQGRRYRGVWGCNPPPIIQTLVKVGQNGTDICPKLVKMELIFA
jgi:hypothetical protein